MKKGELIKFEDYKKERHLVVVTEETTYAIPNEVFLKVVKGELEVTDMDDYEPIIRVVIDQWLYLNGADSVREYDYD